MARILLVQDDPEFCEAISDYLKSSPSDELQYAFNGHAGAALLSGGRFEIALIDANLPDRSGVELARAADNQNVPVLMLSDSPHASAELECLHYRYLQKPFAVDVLIAETRQVLLDRRANVNRIKESFSKMGASLDALRAEMAESHRLFDAIVARLGYWRN